MLLSWVSRTNVAMAEMSGKAGFANSVLQKWSNAQCGLMPGMAVRRCLGGGWQFVDAYPPLLLIYLISQLSVGPVIVRVVRIHNRFGKGFQVGLVAIVVGVRCQIYSIDSIHPDIFDEIL